MTKRDDKMARDALRAWCAAGSFTIGGILSAVPHVGRAIAAAREEERKRCAKIADEREVIWLSPLCPRTEDQCDHPDGIFADVGGRMWCEDCVWSECPSCGAKPTRYTLSEDESQK